MTSNVNNSVIFHRRTVPRVANERYCYIFFIFRVIWGEGVKGGPLGGTKKKRKMKKKILITQLWVVTERSRRGQMKGIAIYFWFLGSASPAPAPATGTGAGIFFLITQLWVVTECSRRWQMKGIAIYFLFLGSASPAPAPATGTGAGKTSNVNNSALGGHRALPKVANERYCYIFFIFGIGIAGTGTGNQHQGRQFFLFQ